MLKGYDIYFIWVWNLSWAFYQPYLIRSISLCVIIGCVLQDPLSLTVNAENVDVNNSLVLFYDIRHLILGIILGAIFF